MYKVYEKEDVRNTQGGERSKHGVEMSADSGFRNAFPGIGYHDRVKVYTTDSPDIVMIEKIKKN